MKVKDLIEALGKYNPHADITLNNSEDITLSFVWKSNEEVFDKSTSPIVFIEPSDFCQECVHEYMEYGARMCSFYEKACYAVEECYAFEEFVE